MNLRITKSEATRNYVHSGVMQHEVQNTTQIVVLPKTKHKRKLDSSQVSFSVLVYRKYEDREKNNFF